MIASPITSQPPGLADRALAALLAIAENAAASARERRLSAVAILQAIGLLPGPRTAAPRPRPVAEPPAHPVTATVPSPAPLAKPAPAPRAAAQSPTPTPASTPANSPVAPAKPATTDIFLSEEPTAVAAATPRPPLNAVHEPPLFFARLDGLPALTPLVPASVLGAAPVEHHTPRSTRAA